MMYGHVQVEVKTGTFENETSDCLLVFLDKQDLHKISYKNKLLELAGDEVKGKWMDHRRRGQFNRKVILVTTGGKLECSKIIHVPCDINTINDAAREGLMRANKSKMKTIVIPLLHDDILMRDVKKCRKVILSVIEDLATNLKDVQSVTLVIEEANKIYHHPVSKSVDPPRSAAVKPIVQQSSPDKPGHDPKTYMQSVTEASKRDHDSARREQSVYPPRSASTEAVVQQISSDKPGRESKSHLQLMPEASKRDHRSAHREQSMDVARSAPTEAVVQQISPDEPGHESKPHQQLITEVSKRDHRSARREQSMDPARSAPTEAVVQQISPHEPGHESKPHQQLMTEVSNRDHRSACREQSMDPARSAPTEAVVQQISPHEPGHESKPHQQLMTEVSKRDHRSARREQSMDPARSAPTEAVVQQISPDEPGHESKPHQQLMTEASKRDHRSAHREQSVDVARSAPTEAVVQQISPDEPGHESKPHQQLITEVNKRDHRSAHREQSMDPARSAPTEAVVQQISPHEPGHESKPHQQLMTEVSNRDHRSARREQSMDPARSAPTEAVVQQISPHEPGHESKPHQQLMTEASKRDHHSAHREQSVDVARSAPTEAVVQQISPHEPGHESKPHQQLITEVNKRDHRSAHREQSMDPARSAPTEAVVQQISPHEPGHESKPHQQLMTEASKRDHHSARREQSVDPPRSAPTEPVVQQISPDEPGRELKTHLQVMTEASKRDHRSASREQSVDPPRSAPTEPVVQQISPVEPGREPKTHLQSMTDIKGLEHCIKPFKVEPLQPQELDFHTPDGLVERAHNTGQKETLFTNLKEISEVEVSLKGNSGATTRQMNTAKNYLESSTPDEESSGHISSLNNVSEMEFKALQIIENGFEKGVHISWDGNSVVISGSPALAPCVQKKLSIRLGALRNKQSSEFFLDEEEKKIVKAVIEEVQSKDTICVYDEKTSQVVVYSDKQDDIRKFKHKLKIRTGKVKESGRSRQRFAENAQLLEACQDNFSSSLESKEIQREFSWSSNASDVEVFHTKENIKVVIYKANILNLPVDCIVNAANDKLQHGGGVAKVIADAAGSELVRQGNATIREKRNRKITVGCQVTTTAGRLPYKCVIHTVGPCWADYEPHNLQKVKECEKDLYAAIYGCFLEAEKNCLSSIALPAVSSGIYAVPQDMCAVQYARAVFNYSRQSVQGQSLKEIHFIDKLPHLVKLMQDTFRTMIENEKVPNYNIQNFVASSSSCQMQQSKETGRKGHGNQYETTKLKELSPFYYEPIVHHTKQFVFQVSAKPVVCIYEGDILKVKNMDAIVCPDDSKGSGMGRIAVELGTRTKYRQQKEKIFERQKPNLGDVVITYGEENSFSVIVHVVVESNCPQKSEFRSTIQKSMNNILRKTNERVQVKTIALPLFGVKRELLTEKSWAKLFLERFVAFCFEVKNPNLEEVHIITHVTSSRAYSTVKKVFTEFADEVNKTCLQEKVPPPRPAPPKINRTSDHKEDSMPIKGHESKNGEGDIDDSCTICMCPKTDPKALSCGHSFCSECIDQMFKHKPVCPICGKIVGTLTGDQPKDGRMDVKISVMSLAGYENHGSIVVTYDFPAGKQGPNHPSPGVRYGHMTRTAYLPNTLEGKNVCRMLQLAFDRRLVFTISTSRTTGQEGLTWNDIHHKTNPNPGAQFGYPDPDYLSRVKDELAAKGITEADL